MTRTEGDETGHRSWASRSAQRPAAAECTRDVVSRRKKEKQKRKEKGEGAKWFWHPGCCVGKETKRQSRFGTPDVVAG